ncbi:MAG: sulfurtransferase TusA family protein [Pseudomonadota bacterium]
MNSENHEHEVDAELDARGFLCPLPVLKLRKRIAALNPSQTIRITADDPAAVVDVPHFCAEQGHKILSKTVNGALSTFIIEKS